jgi:hypothetical protein
MEYSDIPNAFGTEGASFQSIKTYINHFYFIEYFFKKNPIS